MRICFIYYSVFSLGGIQRCVTEIANYLIDNDHDVYIICTNDNIKVDREIYGLNKNVKIIVLKKPCLLKRIIKKFINVVNNFLGIFNNEKILKFVYNIYNEQISEILKKVGMNVLNVAMKSEDGQFYVSNLVLIDENYYYFDVTLETVVYQDNKVNDDEFVLCCGALGRRSYEQFFKPLCILDFNNSLGESKLPNNIAMDDIDIDLVNKLLTLGNDISEE